MIEATTEAKQTETSKKTDPRIDMVRGLFKILPVELKVTMLCSFLTQLAADTVGKTDEEWAPVLAESREKCGDDCDCYVVKEIAIGALYALVTHPRSVGAPAK